MSRHPEVKWAQRLDKVYITVQLPDARDVKVNLEPDGSFTFSATAGAGNNTYELQMDLFDKVNKEASKINIGVRSIFCVVEKAERGWWKKLLRGDGKAPHYVKVDWDKWVDEDDDGPGDLDLGGMDFSNFGNMGVMPWTTILKIVMMKGKQRKLKMRRRAETQRQPEKPLQKRNGNICKHMRRSFDQALLAACG